MKKIILFILLGAVLFIAASCGGESEQSAGGPERPDGQGGGEEAVSDGVEPGEDLSGPEEIVPDLPDVTFGGYDFVMRVRGPEQSAAWEILKNIWSEEMDGTPMNDAVYTRNRRIEDKYDINIVAVPSTSATGTAANITSLVRSGDENTDVFIPGMNQIGSLISEGILVDLNGVAHLDLSKPWWDSNVTRDLSVGGKLYATIGDICISTMNATAAYYFNKKLHSDFGLEDMYNIVREGKWTLDKMAEMGRGAVIDLNGDGIFNNQDQFGLIAQKTITFGFFYLSGENITVNGAGGLPEPSIGNMRSVNALSKAIEALTFESGAFVGGDDETSEMFRSGQGLFYSHVLHTAERLRANELNFGIIPAPKLDEAQERHYSYADSWCTSLLGIPVTNDNLERTGVILEALAAESMLTLVPAYYEINLASQFFRDDESVEMLEIIRESRILSADELYNWGMTAEIGTIIDRGNTSSIVSRLDTLAGRLENSIERTLDAININ